jgi:hypothetical protein
VIYRGFAVVLTVTVLNLSASAPVLVDGSVIDCTGGQKHTLAHVDVFALDAKTPQLISLLRAAEQQPNPDDPASVSKYFSQYERLTRLLKSARRLASAKSGASGEFKLTLSPRPESLVLIAYAEGVDGPACKCEHRNPTLRPISAIGSTGFCSGTLQPLNARQGTVRRRDAASARSAILEPSSKHYAWGVRPLARLVHQYAETYFSAE